MRRVVVVGLGPGDPGLVSLATREAIDAVPAALRFVRTCRHPSAHLVAGAASFDGRYEAGATLEEVYRGIVATLLDAARAGESVVTGHGAVAGSGEVLYAVPGSPLVAERTVELLRAEGPRCGVSVVVLPALSFLDLAWARLGVDPVAAGVRLVDGHRFATEAAGVTGPLLVGQCDRRLVLSDIKLAVEQEDGEPGPVVFLQRLGLPDEAVTEVAWSDLDRSVEADHLTSLWIPQLAPPVAGEVARLVELMRELRARCPWDRAQSHASLRRHLLEESYEVLEAIDELPAGEGWEHLEEELGDLLFQVVFHAQLAGEEGRFGFSDVARGIHDKLVARHPHLFAGDVQADSSDESWEQRKLREKGRTSVVDGVPLSLPALARAEKLQRRAVTLGLDLPDAGAAWSALEGELAGLREAVAASGAGGAGAGSGTEPEVAALVGGVLFGVVDLARKLDVDAEAALRCAAGRFARRVAAAERLAAAAGVAQDTLAALPPAELDAVWQAAGATGPAMRAT